MDCNKLHSDIEKLKSLRDELASKLEDATESGLGKVALSSARREASSHGEAPLEEYAYDLVEQNINDPSNRNSEFLNSILERYLEEEKPGRYPEEEKTKPRISKHRRSPHRSRHYYRRSTRQLSTVSQIR